VRRILSDVLHGLHAAHTATNVDGDPLGIVHRDVSPENIMVGTDGIARVLDFGVAKTSLSTSYTAPGRVKGKLAYMAPEQVRQQPVDARTDVFAAGVVLWEALSGRRLFKGDTSAQVVSRLLLEAVPSLATRRGVGPELDQVIERALARAPAERFASAGEFADALEATGKLASRAEVGAWVQKLAGAALALRIGSSAELDADTVRVQVTPASRSPRKLRVLHRWLRKHGRRRSAAFAATIAVLATTAGCLLFAQPARRTETSSLDRRAVMPLGTDPCVAASSPSRRELLPVDSAVPPPLQPESLHLETSPKVRRSKVGPRRPAAAPPARSAIDVLGF
jgi:serine/threonine-protein kinase